MKQTVVALISIGLVMAAVSGFALAKDNKALAKKHAKIEREFPDVQHIKADDETMDERNDVVIFDVREKAEFDVSHLEGAIQVDPGITTKELLSKYADIIEGKKVVFYCSVGQRSSNLAHQSQSTLIDKGATAAYNLEGGIFNWHNEQRDLVANDHTPTNVVHPYNAYWGRMVNDQSKTAYKPEQ